MAAQEHVGNAQETRLAGALTAAGLSFSVQDGSDYPSGATGKKFVISIGEGGTYEKVLCTERTGDNFTVDPAGRGYDGTTAVAHSAGAKVRHVLAASKVQELDDFMAKGSLLTVGAAAYGGLTIPTGTLRRITHTPTTTGTEVAYTVPTGKVAILLSVHAANSGASVVFTSYLVPSGGAPSDGSNRWLSYSFAAAGSPNGWGASALLSEGDTIRWKVSASGTVRIFFNVLELDPDTIVTGVSGVVAVADGNKEIYTCPAGKVAVPLCWGDPFAAVVYGGLLYNNHATNSATLTTTIKRSGDSGWFFGRNMGTVASGQTRTDLVSRYLYPGITVLEAGDSLILATNVDTVSYWLPVIEFDA